MLTPPPPPPRFASAIVVAVLLCRVVLPVLACIRKNVYPAINTSITSQFSAVVLRTIHSSVCRAPSNTFHYYSSILFIHMLSLVLACFIITYPCSRPLILYRLFFSSSSSSLFQGVARPYYTHGMAHNNIIFNTHLT